MSTNFYALERECNECGRADKVHIGKSAGGWKFLIKYREHGDYFTYDQFIEYLKTVDGIVDECGRRHTVDEFEEIIENHLDGRDWSNSDNYAYERHADGVEDWGKANAKSGRWS